MDIICAACVLVSVNYVLSLCRIHMHMHIQCWINDFLLSHLSSSNSSPFALIYWTIEPTKSNQSVGRYVGDYCRYAEQERMSGRLPEVHGRNVIGHMHYCSAYNVNCCGFSLWYAFHSSRKQYAALLSHCVLLSHLPKISTSDFDNEINIFAEYL